MPPGLEFSIARRGKSKTHYAHSPNFCKQQELKWSNKLNGLTKFNGPTKFGRKKKPMYE